MVDKKLLAKLRVPPGKRVRLSKYEPGWAQTDELRDLGKDEVKERAQEILDENRRHLREAQQVLYADDRYSVLMILQGMDAAGKDGTVRHVMSGVNPQGCRVTSFKQPSHEELDHDFLWRYVKALPERGCLGIFNRSYYEEVLVVRVHPEILEAQRIPTKQQGAKLWAERYEDINALERHLTRNGTIVLKFFLHISKQEQKKRFLERLDDPQKHWKFSSADLADRARWDDYQKAYEEALAATSTKWAPWYVVPADAKWVARAVIADIVTTTILDLGLRYPEVSAEEQQELARARQRLENE